MPSIRPHLGCPLPIDMAAGPIDGVHLIVITALYHRKRSLHAQWQLPAIGTEAVAAGFLGLVHSFVSGFDQQFYFLAIVRVHANPDTYRDLMRSITKEKRFTEPTEDLLRYLLCVGWPFHLDNDPELIT